MPDKVKVLFLVESIENKLFESLGEVVKGQNYQLDIVQIDKLDFQQNESIKKFISADIVVMDLTNKEQRPTFMYHKGNRESYNYTDDILLIQANGVETRDEIQDLKTTFNIKRFIIYRYVEKTKTFCDFNSAKKSVQSTFRKCLKNAVASIESKMSDRYFDRIDARINGCENKLVTNEWIWTQCDEIFNEKNAKLVSPKLIIRLMYYFRENQDYKSMIKLFEKYESTNTIWENLQNNIMILYLMAFARSRRNEADDRDKALDVLNRICEQKPDAIELSNDITCLIGRIYKDKYTDSKCQDQEALEQAIKWYQRGFENHPNIYAGINFLSLFTVKYGDIHSNSLIYKTIIHLNTMLGKRARSSKESHDYWDMATLFELQVVLRDWKRACQAALDMYLLNPPIWYLTSTINNIKILHEARSAGREQKLKLNENSYNFWIEFFCDAIKSSAESNDNITAEIPIIICEMVQQTGDEKVQLLYIEAHLELNFQTEEGNENLVVRSIDSEKFSERTFRLNSIQLLNDVKGDNRSLFFFGHDQSESFSSPLQLCFSSSNRRATFREQISKVQQTPSVTESQQIFNLTFRMDDSGFRQCIGSGSYGRVYIATDTVTLRTVAVKEVHVRNPAHMELLENEVKIFSKMRHKYVTRYEGTRIEMKNKTPIFQIIMEYIDGISIQRCLEKFGPFKENIIRIYTRKILEGLNYLHQKRILHRDIKTANILITNQGEIKITDFGTAKRLIGFNLCKDSEIGTPNYMSPEVITVSGSGYGPEVDLWSVGCTVIEMATGKPPFHSYKNPIQVIYKIGSDRQPPEIPDSFSPEGKDFLRLCFSSCVPRPTAESLLKHPFVRKLPTSSSDQNIEYLQAVSDKKKYYKSSSSSSQESDDTETVPSRQKSAVISIDEQRRSDLALICDDDDCRDKLLARWMALVQEKQETNFLNREKLTLIFDAVRSELTQSRQQTETLLGKLFSSTSIDENTRIDIEQALYLFIRAMKLVLIEFYPEAPHVAFARDNIIRRSVERILSLTRTDFLSADSKNSESNERIIYDNLVNFPRVFSNQSSSNDEVSDLPNDILQAIDQYNQKCRQLIEFQNEIQMKISSHRRTTLQTNCTEFAPIPPSPLFLTAGVSTNSETFGPSSMFPTPSSSLLKRRRQLMSIDEDEHSDDSKKKHIPQT